MNLKSLFFTTLVVFSGVQLCGAENFGGIPLTSNEHDLGCCQGSVVKSKTALNNSIMRIDKSVSHNANCLQGKKTYGGLIDPSRVYISQIYINKVGDSDDVMSKWSKPTTKETRWTFTRRAYKLMAATALAAGVGLCWWLKK